MRRPRQQRRPPADHPRNTNETPKHLRDFAKSLHDAANSLEDTAQKMDDAGLNFLNVRCGLGAAEYLETKIIPFAKDAARKLKEYGG